jgi:hypothetical protein
MVRYDRTELKTMSTFFCKRIYRKQAFYFAIFWLFSVADATITPHTLNFVKKLVSTFGVGIENVSNVVTTFSSAASESLARRAQATAQDPIFQKMKSQFTTDFDFRYCLMN